MQEQEQERDAGRHAGSDATDVSEALYSRTMPGGGYVRVEMIVSEPGVEATERARGRVVMERRAPAPATPEEEHMIVEEVEGDDPNTVVDELFRIAQDNAAIARRVLRRMSTG